MRAAPGRNTPTNWSRSASRRISAAAAAGFWAGTTIVPRSRRLDREPCVSEPVVVCAAKLGRETQCWAAPSSRPPRPGIAITDIYGVTVQELRPQLLEREPRRQRLPGGGLAVGVPPDPSGRVLPRVAGHREAKRRRVRSRSRVSARKVRMKVGQEPRSRHGCRSRRRWLDRFPLSVSWTVILNYT